MWLKACMKCSGDLYLRDSEGGKEIACMQCGFIASPAVALRFLRTHHQTEHQTEQPLLRRAA